MSNLHERMLLTRRGSNPQPPALQFDAQAVKNKITLHSSTILAVHIHNIRTLQNLKELSHIAADNILFSQSKCLDSFLIPPQKHQGMHQKHLKKALLMSITTLCSWAEIRKILCGYHLSSGTLISGMLGNVGTVRYCSIKHNDLRLV